MTLTHVIDTKERMGNALKIYRYASYGKNDVYVFLESNHAKRLSSFQEHINSCESRQTDEKTKKKQHGKRKKQKKFDIHFNRMRRNIKDYKQNYISCCEFLEFQKETFGKH